MLEYVQAESLDQTVSLLTKYGREGKILSGGTELLVSMRQRATNPRYLVDIKRIGTLSFIEKNKDKGVKVGALVLLRELEKSPLIIRQCAALAEAAGEVGTFQLRNMGTIGGNICQERKCLYYNQSHIDLFMRESLAPCWTRGGKTCHAAGKDSLFHSLVGAHKCWASCCSDLLIALSCLDASIGIAGPNGRRSVPADSFWQGPEAGKNVLDSSELVEVIEVPSFQSGTKSTYLKHKRDVKDFAIVCVGVRGAMSKDRWTDLKIVLGGISPTPFRAASLERVLKEEKITEDRVSKTVTGFLKETIKRTNGPAGEFKILMTGRLLKEGIRRVSNRN